MPGTSGSPCSVSRIDLGWPGRLMISAPLRTTATWRDRIAVGTNFRLMARICSPKPGISFSATASVASGVTSRGAGAAGGEHEMAAALVDQLSQRLLDRPLLIGDQPRLVAPGGRGDGRLEP